MNVPEVAGGVTIPRPNDPTLMGYTFHTWYKDSSFTPGNEWVFTGANADKVTQDTTLYAHWNGNTISIRYFKYVDDELTFITVKEGTYGNQFGSLANNLDPPSKVDYFRYWESKWDDAHSITIRTDMYIDSNLKISWVNNNGI